MMGISDVRHQRVNMQCECHAEDIKKIYRKLMVMGVDITKTH
jgi:hypothetical protein